ncbi:hypothetical protein V1478_001915, partial [Vespula squamosa]
MCSSREIRPSTSYHFHEFYRSNGYPGKLYTSIDKILTSHEAKGCEIGRRDLADIQSKSAKEDFNDSYSFPKIFNNHAVSGHRPSIKHRRAALVVENDLYENMRIKNDSMKTMIRQNSLSKLAINDSIYSESLHDEEAERIGRTFQMLSLLRI